MNRLESDQVERLQSREQLDRLASEAKIRSVEGIVSDRAHPSEIEFVDVNRLPETPEIRGPQDFKGNTLAERQTHYESLKRELLRQEQMRPNIEQGHGPETWDAWDDQQGIGQASPVGHVRGYADVHRAYYDKDNAIAVSEVDGRYVDIINGRHRVFLARELGIRKLPVHVQRA